MMSRHITLGGTASSAGMNWRLVTLQPITTSCKNTQKGQKFGQIPLNVPFWTFLDVPAIATRNRQWQCKLSHLFLKHNWQNNILCYKKVQNKSLCLPLFKHVGRKKKMSQNFIKPRDVVKVSQAENWNRHYKLQLGKAQIISHILFDRSRYVKTERVTLFSAIQNKKSCTAAILAQHKSSRRCF